MRSNQNGVAASQSHGAQPRKRDIVKLLVGRHAGRIGRVIGKDGADLVIQLAGDVAIEPRDNVTILERRS